MLRLSKKADYALIAMRHLAGAPADSSVSAREIAESYGIPAELLAKVLQRLVRSRLLVSVQGTRGGYRLAGEPQRLTVADVIQAIDGPVAVFMRPACRGGVARDIALEPWPAKGCATV